jgi:plasmid stabilization system protein ParE
MDSIKSIIWSKRALRNFSRIVTYITQNDSITRAAYVGQELIETVEKINPFPEKHPVEPNINIPDVRFIMKWKYKIIFQIGQDTISILQIFHTAQNPGKLRKR